jgi:hypothetical protein
MKFDLYWGTMSLSTSHWLGQYDSYDEAWKAMVAHQKLNHSQLGYYYRCWKNEDGTMNVDYGSHVHYYFIVPSIQPVV